jgi:AAA domain
LDGANVDLIPGRLTLHLFEAKVGERWSGIYQGDPLAIRTATRIREMVFEYAKALSYDIIIFDTSPSLGALNRNLLSLADGFIIPCSPDLFSVYGIRNIGNALNVWRRQFESIFTFLSDAKRDLFPRQFVRFMGYTLYNAKKYSKGDGELALAQAHLHFAEEIPRAIQESIETDNILKADHVLDRSIGKNAVIYSHNTFPSVSQKYHLPMWKLPDSIDVEPSDRSTIAGNQGKYRDTRQAYKTFASEFLDRVGRL